MKVVSEILKTKVSPNNIIQSDALVYDALVLMNSVNLSYLVVFENDHFVGIFSERDYTRKLVLHGKSSTSTKIKEVMSSDLPCVSLSDTAEKCMRMLDTYKTRYLPVFDNVEFKGVITLNDVLRLAINSKEDVFDELANSLVDWDDKIF